MQPDQRIVDTLVERIVNAVHPLRIILFGSAARGDMKPGSDLDVLVVMPDGTHRLNAMGHLYRHMIGLRIPVDIIVTTPAHLDRYKNDIGLIYRIVLREGKEVYAASLK
jgi:predicted nucleotidyltransferase